MTILVVFLVLALFSAAATLFGADSRDSREWEYRGPQDRTTALHS